MDRHAIIAQEYHFAVDDEMPVYRFMQLSELAQARLEAKKDAARKNEHFIG